VTGFIDRLDLRQPRARWRWSSQTRRQDVPVDVRGKYDVVTVGSDDGRVLMLAHGFGGDQHMWRLVEPLLSPDFRVREQLATAFARLHALPQPIT
jgi:pimeloyl-ACP methyl ester carboxylesterase